MFVFGALSPSIIAEPLPTPVNPLISLSDISAFFAVSSPPHIFIALRFWAPLKEEFFIETFPCDSTISVESAESAFSLTNSVFSTVKSDKSALIK